MSIFARVGQFIVTALGAPEMDERLKPRPPGSYAQVRADEEEPLFGWTLDSVVCALREFCAGDIEAGEGAAPGDDARSGYRGVRRDANRDRAPEGSMVGPKECPQWVLTCGCSTGKRRSATATTNKSANTG